MGIKKNIYKYTLNFVFIKYTYIDKHKNGINNLTNLIKL
jgi:hypothetical protein